MAGWIKAYRNLQYHYLWQEKPFSKGQAWLDLILMANHQERKVPLGSQIILVERGSFITSELKLMEKWGWSKSKVRAFLKLLENDSMLVRKTDRKKTTLSIVNYDVWQDSETTEEPLKDHKKTNKGPLKDTNKNDKNIKNDKNEKNSSNSEHKINYEKNTTPTTNIFNFYQKNIGMLNEHSANILESFVQDGLHEELILKILKLAVERDKKNLAYIKKILSDCLDKNIKNLLEFEHDQEKFTKKYSDSNKKTPNNFDQGHQANFDERTFKAGEYDKYIFDVTKI